MRMRVIVAAAAALAVFGAVPALTSTHARFPDVPADHPQRAVISYAVHQGWFQGYPDGAFKPGQAISDSQVASVFSRAFPDGVTRAEMAAVMKAGVLELATPDLADPEPSGQSGEGRILPAELPVIRVQNLPYNRNGVETYVEVCHVTHKTSPGDTISNLRSRCNDQARVWKAFWQYIPKGLDVSNLFVWAEMDGENKRLDTGWRQGVSNVDFLKPLLVRDVLGRKVDVRMECIRYEGWSEKRVSAEDVPYEDCLDGG